MRNEIGMVFRIAAVVAAVILSAPVSSAQESGTTLGEEPSGRASGSSGSPEAVSSQRVIEEIVVTARRREESLQDTPVWVNAIRQDELNRYGLTQVQAIADLTPQLFVTEGQGGEQGSVTLRGIGAPPQGGFEQAVSIYLDGVQYSRADVISQGFFDLGQVEVLKGPQALLFGKNNSAGVISISTADPGDELELIGRTGYEFRADKVFGEAIASGPVTQNFGARLALRYSSTEGYIDNFATPAFDLGSQDTAPAPTDARWPDVNEFLGRLTLVYTPVEDLEIKVKVSGATFDNNGQSQRFELISCKGLGRARVDPLEPCRRDWKTRRNDVPPSIAAAEPRFGKEDGRLYGTYDTYSIAVPIQYSFDWGTFNSITGITSYELFNIGDYDFTGFSDGYLGQGAENDTYSQELRFLTAFDFPVNLMVGGFYQRLNHDTPALTRAVPLPADPFTGRFATAEWMSERKEDTWSGFGQLIWDVTDAIELTAGARYTNESKDFSQVTQYVHPFVMEIFGFQGQTLEGNFDDDNVSTEVSLSWRPFWLEDATFFASYREGFKSGGFASVLPIATNTIERVRFESETASGFEGGIKSTWRDNRLRLNVVGYRYDYDDLQRFFFEATTRSNFVQNAASATMTGTEADLLWLPAFIEGLTVRGSLAYNVSRYGDFLSFCWGGQTRAAGCNLDANRNPAMVGSRQQLRGEILPVAPRWVIGGGFLYEQPIAYDLFLALGADSRWTDNYGLSSFNRPDSRQGSFFRTDASFSVMTSDRRVEFGVVGRNLSNQHFVSGTTTEAPNSAGGTGTDMGLIADEAAPVNPPREVGLQLTLRY